jgi:hypothetical protein
MISLVVLPFLPACTPTPTPGGGATTTGCGISPQQGGNGLGMDCTVTGGLPNMLIDPANSSNSSCALTSFSLFGQTVNAPIHVIYGENGDDNDARVRLGATINGATHSGSLAKSAVGCGGTVGPVANVTTNFGGRHIALIDKGRSPMCVFQSRLDVMPFNQSISLGFNVDVSSVTESSVRRALERRMDLELATAVNRLLNPSADVTAAGFVNGAGRCPGDYQPFVGN